MDAMQDEKDIHDQISDAISRGHGDVLDDVSPSLDPLLNFSMIFSNAVILYHIQEDLEEELNALLALDLEEAEAAAAAAPTYYAPPPTLPSLNLPSAPTTALKVDFIILIYKLRREIWHFLNINVLKKMSAPTESEEDIALRELQAAMYA